MKDVDYEKLVDKASSIAKSLVFFMPRNTCPNELRKFAPMEGHCFIEKIHMNKSFVGILVYYGELAKKFIDGQLNNNEPVANLFD